MHKLQSVQSANCTTKQLKNDLTAFCEVKVYSPCIRILYFSTNMKIKQYKHINLHNWTIIHGFDFTLYLRFQDTVQRSQAMSRHALKNMLNCVVVCTNGGNVSYHQYI